MREGLKRLLRETDEEINYQRLDEMERETQMEEYDSKQDQARCLIIERLDDYRLRRINPTLTALQIMKVLDNEYNTTSTIGLMTKREAYMDSRFHPGRNLERFIEIHEAKPKDYTDAGGTILENDRVLQLHRSIPVEFDSALDWWENLPTEKKNV